MTTIPAKIRANLVDGIKKYQPIVKKARDKDVNESDTVTIIADMLSDIFGYDKYSEVTSEFAIKKTFCDLAIKLDGEPKLLIEAKAAGLELKDQHIKQAVDYGANSGIEWVVLTNGVYWKIYNIVFAKPVSHELVYEFNFTEISPKKESDLEMLYILTRDAMTKGGKTSLDTFYSQQQLVNRYTISQIMLTDGALDFIRKTLRKLSPDAKTTNEQIAAIITEEIIKRDVLEDDKAKETKKKVAKAMTKPPKQQD